MAIDPQVAIAQLDAILAEIDARRTFPTSGQEWVSGSDSQVRELRTRAVATIERLAPKGSAYLHHARSIDEGRHPYGAPYVVSLAGVLRALRNDYAAGYTTTIEELIHADLFSDFLEMADELLVKRYKDAAAVIAGSVLEEHLRQLANKHDVAVTSPQGASIKADKINAELAAKPAYNKLEQKSVTAWLDLRNNAAHGKYSNYDHSQVAALIRDVRAFMGRHPA